METFDELDFGILREIWTGASAYFRSDRVSMEEVARALGVHRSTVAARIAKWERTGFLAGFGIDVDSTAIGLVGAHVQFHAQAAPRDRALRLAALVDGVQGLLLFDRGWVGVPIHADSSAALDRVVELIEGILDADETLVVADTRVDFPDARPVPLTPLDARILLALLEDSRRAPRAIAADLGVAPRTVERRLAHLREESVFYVFLHMRMEALRGMVVGYLAFGLPERDRARALHEVLARAPHHHVRQVEAPTRGRLLLHAPAVADLERMAAAVAEVPGVTDVVLRILTGLQDAPHFREWLSERIVRHAGSPKPLPDVA